MIHRDRTIFTFGQLIQIVLPHHKLEQSLALIFCAFSIAQKISAKNCAREKQTTDYSKAVLLITNLTVQACEWTESPYNYKALADTFYVTVDLQ